MKTEAKVIESANNELIVVKTVLVEDVNIFAENELSENQVLEF